jgi:hypothetical protein
LRDDDGHVNVYVIAADRFPQLYEPMDRKSELGDAYGAKAVVCAVALPGGLDIVAPWGERQTVSDGYLLCNGAEVYGSNAAAFQATYKVLER